MIYKLDQYIYYFAQIRQLHAMTVYLYAVLISFNTRHAIRLCLYYVSWLCTVQVT
jgi:hypothetical protein